MIAANVAAPAPRLRIVTTQPTPPPLVVPPYWLTGPCPAWCDIPHSGADADEDRVHLGVIAAVPLVLEDPVRYAGGHVEPQVARALLTQHYRQSAPQIEVFAGDGPTAWRMTTAEARAFAAQLIALADQGDAAEAPQSVAR